MSTNGVGKSYDEFIESIKARGLDTTHLGKGEANFEDYGNALGADLKEELLQSIGDEEGDLELQSKIAGLFEGKSVMHRSDLISAAKDIGLTCTVEYKKTSYIPDNKLDGHYDTDTTTGSIAVYTFSDGNSTIKIADANGNGSLEIEEIYLNEILGDVTSSIGVTSSGSSTGTGALEEAKKRQEALLMQIEENQKQQQEILMGQLEKTRNMQMQSLEEMQIDENIFDTNKSKTDNKDENQDQYSEDDGNEMSETKFKKLVLEKALSRYNGYADASIEEIERAAKEIKLQYGVDIDLSYEDMLELSREYAKEKEKIDEENN